MADFSDTQAIDNTQEYAILAPIDGIVRVAVQENYNSSTPPTADLVQRCAHFLSQLINIAKGTPAIYTTQRGGYSVGDKVGTIKTASGSITISRAFSTQV